MKKFIALSLFLCALFQLTYAQDIKPDFFKTIPEEIDGCSGLYTYATTQLKGAKYIFVTNLDEVALIRISGRTIKLKRTLNKEISPISSKQTFIGGGYTVTLLIKGSKRTGDELSEETGTLEISKGTDRTTIRIHGESGC